MTQLSALNVRITGDAGGLQAAVSSATTELQKVSTAAGKANTAMGPSGLAGGMSRLSNLSGQTKSRIQNVGYQVADMAVQFDMGTRASTIFAQQGSQILAAFGPVGAVLGALAAVGLPLLGAAFAASGAKALTLDDRMKSLSETMASLQGPMDILKLSTSELALKYGEAADRVRQFALAQAELAASQAASRMSEQVSLLDDVIARYVSSNNAGRDYALTLRRIGDDFGLAKKEAAAFETILQNVRDAKTFEEQQDALKKVLEFLQQYNIALEVIPSELQRAISEMITLSNETDRARAVMEQLGQASRGIMGPSVAGGRGQDPRKFTYTDDFRDQLKKQKPEAAKRQRGGARRANPLEAELEKLQQSLLSQEKLQMESFARQQEVLRGALDQRLVTQQEYASLMEQAQAQHTSKMAQIDAYRYGSGLQQASTFFGDMAGALSQGNDKMLKIAQKFAAAEALIKAWLGYAQTIGDPTLPWFAKIPKAVAVLAAGMNAVSAIKGGGRGGGSTGGAAASVSPAPQITQQRIANISFQGSFAPTPEAIGMIASGLNDWLGDGGQLNIRGAT